MNLKLKATADYEKLSVEETMEFLKTNINGLSTNETSERINQFGYNEIPEIKRNSIVDFFKRYWGPMPWLLELAIIITLILKHYTESGIIFTLLTINAVIGYSQSNNSQKAIEMIKKKLAIKAKVLRDGKWVLKEAREIVPGDIINLKLGDLVPADMVIINGEISVDQSALTGESLPKNAHSSNLIYSSSIVKRGEALCVVINIGINTYFGKTVQLIKIAKPKSKQEELMINIVKYMMYLGIVASIIVSVYAFYLQKDCIYILSFVVIFLIGAIPVALPAVLTIVQAIGATELSKKGVLVAKLDSIEDAASIDIFCFDKTGTITQNKLSIVDSICFGQFSAVDVIKIATLASKENGMDAIDLAIIDYSKSLKINFEDYEQTLYTPFNPESKKTEAIIKFKSNVFKVIKGASQTIANLCDNIDNETANKIDEVTKSFSQKGYRTIAVAISENGNTKIVGLMAIADYLRSDSKVMLEKIKELGIKSIMLTGDSIDIAREIAKQAGIGSRIIRANELNNLDYNKQLELIENNDGFAEVYPEDKYRIVKLLQESGHMVGMTGDGVNDSPALKQAELGTAVSGATDVARASASIVLTKPGLGEIIDAVVISRKTYQRMLTWVINKIVKVVEFVTLLTVSFFWLHDVVISLFGMSLLVFVNDFLTMSIATDNVKSTKYPNKWHIKNITSASLILGILFAIEDLVIIFIGINYFNLEIDQICTLVLLSLILNTQFRLLIVRERKHFWSSFPSKSILIVSTITIVSSLLLCILGFIISKLLISQVLITLLIAIIFILSLDIIKYYLFKKLEI